jgi:exosortase/archaeosortase family protein
MVETARVSRRLFSRRRAVAVVFGNALDPGIDARRRRSHGGIARLARHSRLPHGNVIEVATGEVGIDEACSGIRSFQATLMTSLFLGEFYRLNSARRMILVLGGFAMSFLFNLARMSVLVWVAAHQGIAAIAKWHDPTGVTILLACFCGLWGLGIFLARQKFYKPTRAEVDSEIKFKTPARSLLPWLISLGIWIFAVEISVEFWYRSHEARLPVALQWTIAWPTNNPTFKEMPLADATRQILRFNEGCSVAWTENNLDWQAIFLRWNPGQTAIHLAQNHTPEVCMTAAGHTLTTNSEREWFDVGGLRLPFLVCEVTDVRVHFTFSTVCGTTARARRDRTRCR